MLLKTKEMDSVEKLLSAFYINVVVVFSKHALKIGEQPWTKHSKCMGGRLELLRCLQ